VSLEDLLVNTMGVLLLGGIAWGRWHFRHYGENDR
jgi:hypothetical protein